MKGGAPRRALSRMVTLLEAERTALSGLHLDQILSCAEDKAALCDALAGCDADGLDEECRALLDAASRLNATNRKMRNLMAFSIQSRLAALTGAGDVYSVRVGAGGR